MRPDKILHVFVMATLIIPLRVIFAIPQLFIRLIGGQDTTKQDAMTRRVMIETKQRKRWIQAVKEAERQVAEKQRQESLNASELDTKLSTHS